MVEIKNLNFKHHKKDSFALCDLNFRIEDGYMAVLAGKNASGKTTLLQLLGGLMEGYTGEILMDGESMRSNRLEWKRKVVYVGNEQWCEENHSLEETWDFLGDLYPDLDRAVFDDCMKKFGMEEGCLLNDYQALSTGTRMKLQIAFALARHPKLLIMDEPLANLDPVIKQDILEIVHDRAMKEEITVLISTHLVEEVNDMADEVIFIEDGKVKYAGETDQVLEEGNAQSLAELFLKKR